MTNDLRSRLAKPRLWQTVLVCYWLALVVATHLPRNVPAGPWYGIDKLIHLGAFAVLAGLAAVSLQLAGGHVMRRHFRWLWIVIVFYAAVEELTQPPFGRDASVLDWLADAAGALVGLMLFALGRGWLLRRRHSEA